MRYIVIFMLLAFMNSAIAITKCELNGKISYKQGSCPEYATTKYLVKDEYVEETRLQDHRQMRIKQSQKAFKQMNTPRKRSVESEEWVEPVKQQTKSKKVQVSNETAQLQDADKLNSKSDKVNAPKINDGVNDKLSEMEQKLEQHNKELQLLQKQ